MTVPADTPDGRNALAAEVAEVLAMRLAAAARARHDGAAVAEGAPLSYFQARFHWARRMHGQAAAALAALEAAVEAVPTFAPAWTGLAEICTMLPHLDGTPPREAFPRARAAAERARALAPESAAPLVPLAHVAWRYEGDTAGAERLLREALDREPLLLPATQTLGTLLTLAGRPDEGLALLERSLRLHPDVPDTAMELGYAAFFARRYALAERHLRAFLARVPDHPLGRLFLGKTLVVAGRVTEGLAEAEAAVQAAGPHAVVLADLAWVLAAAGRTAEARAALAQAEAVSAGPFYGPSLFAPAYAALGEREAALAVLERAAEERDPMLIHVHAYAGYDALRDEPRFRAVARRMGTLAA